MAEVVDGVASTSIIATPSYSVAHQIVELDVDFKGRKVSGKTEITLHPQSKDLKTITLSLRQCKIIRLTVNSKPVSRMQYIDPYSKTKLAGNTAAHQHHLLALKLANALKTPPDGEVAFDVPKSVHIDEVSLNVISSNQSNLLNHTNGDAPGSSLVDSTQALTDSSIARYTPLIISISFSIDDVRDGIHFVAHGTGAGRFPHAYTPRTNAPGSACCMFPCVDAVNARCTWEIKIGCPRTVGDALRGSVSHEAIHAGPGIEQSSLQPRSAHEEREMIVVCSGEHISRKEDQEDSSKVVTSFSCLVPLSAQQIAFAIGPFEEVKLSDFRVPEDDVGSNAVEVLGYCLPGRLEELRNTCLPTVRAIDFVTRKYVACPFATYRICFVDDLENDTAIAGAFTLCSNRLLYPADIIDVAEDVTRKLVHAIASQWAGINVVPQEPTDSWIVIGIAHYITEAYMRDLCGNNEYRFRMKQQADRVCEMDHNRPSLFDLGTMLQVDPAELEFMSLKASLVLFILDRRIAKVVGLPKMPAIISKILLRARKGELPGNALSTELFQRTCEKFYHSKIDDFLNQWVRGGGCPHFRAFQKFNKKKLVVEMMIRQVQGEHTNRDLEPDTFMRDVREDFHNIWAAPLQNVFTGPITIRVHEADGTPYEHVVEIREAQMRFEIPYNTKYKRLKRSRRQREKNFNAAAAANADPSEAENDALLYCLGDVLQSEEEIKKWRISGWTPEDEEKMSSESYEWIRVDADFEWICKLELNMAGYMYASQLQQDRDVVAQLDAVQAISRFPASPLISSIFLRTVMDKRYFHRLRTSAARAMVRQATPDTDYIGFWHLRKAFEELFCLSDTKSIVARPNDFSNIAAYQLQCGLILAISKIRDAKGIALPEAIEFLLDKLKFNNNDTNPFSDCFYLSMLMQSLCEAICTHGKKDRHLDEMDLDVLDRRDRDRQLEKDSLEVIDRYRRMDEWAGSYQNLYSRTALDCQRRLSDSRIGRASTMHFLQYTRPGNYDMLRLTAFDNLILPKILQSPAVLRYTTFCMSSDPSPWIRKSLRRFFGRLLAVVAIGDHLKSSQAEITEDLVIENDADAGNQQAQAARKRAVDVAIAALKEEVLDNDDLKTSLWAAVSCDTLSLEELQAMLDFCRMLYDPVDSLKITIKYPRYWRLERIGKGKLKFIRTNHVRTKPFIKWVPKALSPLATKYDLLPPKSSGPKLLFKNPVPPPPLQPSPPHAPATSEVQSEPKRSLKIKISMPRPSAS